MINKLDGEKTILFHLLKNSAYFYRVFDKLKKDDFKKQETQAIFEYLKKYYIEFEKKPSVKELALYIMNSSLPSSLKNKIVEYFKGFKGEEEIKNFDFLIDFTENYLKKTALTNAILESVELLKKYDKLEDVDIITKFEEALNYKFDTDLGLEYNSSLKERFEKYNKIEDILPTGINSIDEILGGGFRINGSLSLLLGASHSGKSGGLVAFSAGFLKQGKNGLYVTLEMDEYEILKRIDANILDIPMYELKKISFEEFKNKYEQVKKIYNLGKLFVKEYPAGSFSIFDLEKLMYDIEQENDIKLDFIIIDYMGLMKSTRVRLNQGSYLYFKSISEELHGFSKKHKVPIISAFQLNRCLDLNTEVITKKGTKKIKDLKYNDYILGNDGFKKVKFISNIVKQKVYRIKTKSGKEIIVSGEHKFPTKKGFISINEGLNIGDKLNIISNKKDKNV